MKPRQIVVITVTVTAFAPALALTVQQIVHTVRSRTAPTGAALPQNDGRVAGFGPHRELLRKPGYAEAFGSAAPNDDTGHDPATATTGREART